MTTMHTRWAGFRNWLTLTPPGKLAMAVAVCLLLIAVIIGQLTSYYGAQSRHHSDSQQIADLKAELTCRSDISNAVTQAQADLIAATGQGLVDYVKGDKRALNMEAGRVERASDDLAAAKVARARAEQTCGG